MEDMVGKKYGRLKIVASAGSNGGRRLWRCQCECGKIILAYTAYLKNGHVKSCGCLMKDNRYKKHGLANTATYQSWSCMIQRCYNKKHNSFKNYGGRGVKVCESWHEFYNFYNDMGERPQGHTLDRIDVNGNYCKTNCRWADKATQDSNKRNNRYITYNGETHTVSEWARILNIPRNTLNNRLTRSKWSIEKAFNVKGA